MDGRNYRNCIIVDTSEMRAIVAELKDICRVKSTPELARLQFNRAIRIMEKQIRGADKLNPFINELKAEMKAEAKSELKAKHILFKKTGRRRKA